MLKDEYPEAIADLLGIPPLIGPAGPWMSMQGTVLVEWLMAVGEVLDVPYAGEKTRMMRALVEAVGETWDERLMSSRGTRSGGGGNIRLEAFQALLAGLKAMPWRRASIMEVEADPYSPGVPDVDEDRIVYRAIRDRAGQPQFRARLLEVYGGACAVTAFEAPAALEAAHVIPYGSGGTYELQNGLLLRADIHTLFDKGLLAFSDERRVVIHADLTGTAYGRLEGVDLAEPSPRGWRVPTEALAWHREASGL